MDAGAATQGTEVVVKDAEYREQYGFNDKFEYKFKTKKGLSEEIVREISAIKEEPEWMLEKRLAGYKQFVSKPIPQWSTGNLNEIDYNDIYYYLKPTDKKSSNWNDVPDEIKKTFDKLGIPESERKFFAGAEAQYDSEVVYSHIREDLAKDGVIFVSTDEAVKKYPELMKKYFGTVIPPTDNKYAGLNTAVWSGGCLTEDAFVFTANPGGKSIKNIEEGDTVFALSNESEIVQAKVLAKIYSGNKEVFEFRAGGRTIQSTKNHKFLTLIKSKTPINEHGKKWHRMWKSLEELKEGDLVAIAKKLPDYGKSYKLPELEHYTKNKRLERPITIKETDKDLMWLFGILIGDGNVYFPNKNMCFINIALPVTDPSRNEAIKVVENLFRLKVITQNKASFTIHSKALGNWLKNLGISGKAKTKRIPSWVFGLPKEQRLAFLGGLLDSDGYIDANAGAIVRFELANKVLVEQIKLLAISCGLFSDGKILERKRTAIFKKENRKIYSGMSYSCRISGMVAEIGFRSTKVKKKLELNEKGTFDKYNMVTGENFTAETNEWVGFAPIKELKCIGNKDVYDIQVENHANFIANGIVAHNSFIYIPKGVKLKLPLQAYFRINTEKAGQFERTLIIADEGADVTYIEGCTAPIYMSSSLHSAVVELVAHKDAHIRYVTIQNWSKNVYNLVTQRAFAYENAHVEWIDGNIGSKLNIKYPSVYLKERGARGEIMSIAVAGPGQIQDSGGKIYHLAPDTTSQIISKSVSSGNGVTTYRGLLHIAANASNVKSNVRCDALLLDEESKTNTFPYMEVKREDATITHEASTGKVGEEQLFYLMSRGMSEQEALTTIVLGFLDPLARALPLEYSIELRRLIKIDMSNSVG